MPQSKTSVVIFVILFFCVSGAFQVTCEADDRQKTDGHFKQKIVGTWLFMEDMVLGRTTYREDGSLEGRADARMPGGTISITVRGRWQIEDGALIETIDETSRDDIVPKGTVARDKIDSISDDQMVVIAKDGSRLVKIREISHKLASAYDASINREAAIALSHAIVEDVLQDLHEDMYGKMEKMFRDTIPQGQMKELMDTVYAAFGGKPLDAQFKWDEIGHRFYPTGQKKPMRKFWYAVRTARHEKGSCFLFVEIVPDGNGLAAASVMMARFADEVPPQLR